MEQIPIPLSEGLIGDYVTHVIMNGPWSVWLHIFSLAASATVLVLAFRRADRALVLSLGLLPLAFGLGASYVHAVNRYMIWGPQMFHDHTADFAWEVTSPLRFSALLTFVTFGATIFIRRFRPVLAPPLPQAPSRTFIYRSADGSTCGPCTESKLGALQRMGVISPETLVADTASPDQWATFAAHSGLHFTCDSTVAEQLRLQCCGAKRSRNCTFG